MIKLTITIALKFKMLYLFIVMKNNTMKYNSNIGQNTGISNTMKNVIKKAVTNNENKYD